VQQCSNAASAEVEQIIDTRLLKGVFFATDMPVNGSFRKSNSFRPSKDQQRWGLDVRTRLKERFDVVTWEDYPVVNAFVSGIRGLLDKVTCARGKYYVTAPDACGGGSFAWCISQELPGWKFWSQPS
jgi:hypothetical protein